ncbi:daunorubicin resistance ABC transporter ATPase subunit, partial [mine drainage metagenome]
STVFPPLSGSVEVGGLDVQTSTKEVRALLGVVAQEVEVDALLTVRDNLWCHARLLGLKHATAREKIEALLTDFLLRDKADSVVLTLSGGQMRRVQIARTLLSNPIVLIVDEPTLGLDPLGKDTVWTRIRELATRGTAVLLTSNDMTEVESLCDDVYFLHRGHLVQHGPPARLISALGGGVTVAVETKDESSRYLEAISQLAINCHADGHKLRFEVSQTRQLGPVLARLLSAGADLRDIRVRSPTLTEVFLRVVGDVSDSGAR